MRVPTSRDSKYVIAGERFYFKKDVEAHEYVQGGGSMRLSAERRAA